MKSILYLVFVVFSLVSCSSSKNGSSSSTHDGLTYATAIVIMKKTETKGVDAEYKWIREHYSEYGVKSQSLNFHDEVPYDIITIVLGNETEKKIYFDISHFFGKF